MNIYRLMLGAGSVYAQECFAGSFVGSDFEIAQDLTGQFGDSLSAFNQRFIPVFLSSQPQKSRVAAGLACGTLWRLGKGITPDDLLLCPDGQGHYHAAQVTGGYVYCLGEILPHRRPVRWLGKTIDRASMSDALRHSAGAISTLVDISIHQPEIQQFLGQQSTPVTLQPAVTTLDALAEFAMEKHLEDFLVQNWAKTPMGAVYEIYSENGNLVGQQYPTDTGPIDILAISKDEKTLLVVELKKGRANDVAVGQILRYMGYVREVLAEKDQSVKGVIIAAEDDPRLRRALVMTPEISFYRYQISFKLHKA